MLELRPTCEHCNRALSPNSLEATCWVRSKRGRCSSERTKVANIYVGDLVPTYSSERKGKKSRTSRLSGTAENAVQVPFMACVPWVIAPPARNAAATRTASAIS